MLKLLFSIKFEKNLTSVTEFINNLSNLAIQTNYFQKSINFTIIRKFLLEIYINNYHFIGNYHFFIIQKK